MPRIDDGHRSVLITGAAGSIGSALARTLADRGAKRLVLLDSSETGLTELRDEFKAGCITGNAGDGALLDALFRCDRFDVIYHAAAWKHVPALEGDPFAAIENNALATYTLAQAAIRARVPRLVLISTDKAVNPRSIMGASKRIAELAVTSLSGPACRMNVVRLCNVFGSSGSVVPIFQEQIAERRPVTVTDPKASRWFLTMHEAVEAILAAGRCGQSGKVLMPSVGEPVLIRELAESLIGSSGRSAEIQYIGLRPGEKLAEELLGASEREIGRDAGLGVIETGRVEPERLAEFFCELARCLGARDLSGLLAAVRRAVPEYQPSAHLLRQTAAAAEATA